jgi:hypothetical protein
MANFTLGGFAAHLAGFIIAVKAAEQRALEQAAKLVEATAKAEIGTYQNQAGPFVAWAELADSTKDDRVNKGYAENDPGLRDGDMRDSIGHVVGDREAVIGSDDQNLVWFELGTAKQPPRSVLGTAAVTEGPKIAHILGTNVVKALVGRALPADVPIP